MNLDDVDDVTDLFENIAQVADSDGEGEPLDIQEFIQTVAAIEERLSEQAAGSARCVCSVVSHAGELLDSIRFPRHLADVDVAVRVDA